MHIHSTKFSFHFRSTLLFHPFSSSMNFPSLSLSLSLSPLLFFLHTQTTFGVIFICLFLLHLLFSPPLSSSVQFIFKYAKNIIKKACGRSALTVSDLALPFSLSLSRLFCMTYLVEIWSFLLSLN